jgi:predicted DsbA family dithiol-disulfide isomerase
MNDITTADFGVVVYSDIGCPWAHIAMHRLDRAIRDRGLGSEVTVDHRAFPLEIVNGRPTPKRLLDSEIRVCAELEPDAGWSFDPDPWTYPVSTLPALEAVQAAKSQGPDLSVRLDRALRRAMFGEWRCLAVHAVVFEIAASVDGLDVDALRDAIRSGDARSDIWLQLDAALDAEIPGSPTFVLPDGTRAHNPGIELSHADDGDDEGGAEGSIVVEADDPDAIGGLVDAVVALRPAD